MAGVKGRSGGARPNTGGAREGAGGKPKPPHVTEAASAIEFLHNVMCGLINPNPSQLKAALALARLESSTGAAVGGKKVQREAAAARVATGLRLAPGAPPLAPPGAPTH